MDLTLTKENETAGAHSTPYDWIPVCAGMTEESAGTCPCRGLGCPQICFIIPQEWGIKGVDSS